MVEGSILIWNKDVGFIKINEGTGENLLKEDIKEGYVDYMMIDFVEYDGDEFEVMDGGQVMLKELYKEKFNSIENVVDYLIECDEIPNAVYTVLYAK